MTKKITRRDAIKLLGAAVGATALANLPSKWSKPELISGVLPVHAQTSCISLLVEVISTDGVLNIVGSGQIFDEILWDGTAGSYARWFCQPNCTMVTAYLASGTTGSVRITTLVGSFVVSATSGTWILVDLETGAYDVGTSGGLTAGSCSNTVPVTLTNGLQVETGGWSTNSR